MNTKPINEIKLSSLKAAIWKNETKAGARYNVSFRRIFKNGDKWDSTDSFGRDDLLLLAKVADMAHSWICAQKADGQNSAQAHAAPDTVAS